MLKGLNQIPWGQLQHAGGPASNIPTLLRLLTSSVQEDREYALYELYGSIWHEGAVYQATPFVVPFLLELLEAPDVEGKDELLRLLAHLATGESALAAHMDLPHHELQCLFPHYQQSLDKERTWINDTRNAIVQGLPTFLRLLDADQTELCVNAAYILSHFPQEKTHIQDVLCKHLQKTNNSQRKASLLLALSAIGQDDPTCLELYRCYLTNTSCLTRWAAAIALARHTQPTTPHDVMETLLQTIVKSDSVADLYAELPWARGDIIGDTSLFLCELNPQIAQNAIPQLLHNLERVDPYSALNIAYALLYLSFGEEEEGRNLETLNPQQTLVLNALAQSPNVWTINGNMFEILESFGFPGWREELQAFLTHHKHGSAIIDLHEHRPEPPSLRTPLKRPA